VRIGVPRWAVVALAALFQGYAVIALGLYSIGTARSPYPVYVAMALFSVATALSLIPFRDRRLPIWVAAFDVAVVAAGTLLVSSQLPLDGTPLGYATWYVAAAGALMVIVATRLQLFWAWLGIAFVTVHTLFWAGPAAVLDFGVIGSISWVVVAHVIGLALARAGRESRRFTQAERETADWQAAQEAHVTERQFRLGQTSQMAFRMLQRIQRSEGRLTPAEREECLHLEGAIRDEIRGRKLLNDAVREQVMEARRRGVTVTLLDEGGIDDLPDADLDRVLGELAAALRSTDADRVIARTVPDGSDIAVTVVGLREADEHTRMLGMHDDGEDDVALWLEIPRSVPAVA
jgi:hypothetical protein